MTLIISPDNRLERVHHRWPSPSMTHTTDPSKRHHIKVVHINYLDNVPSNIFQNMLSSLTDDTDLSRRYHPHTFSQKQKCGWENIWRKVVHINYMNNVSSNCFQNMLSSLADDTDLSRRHHLHTFSPKQRCWLENIWRKIVHFNDVNSVSSNMF
jgi:hypothetical protein